MQALLNMACCCLFLLASCIYSIVFKELQHVEHQVLGVNPSRKGGGGGVDLCNDVSLFCDYVCECVFSVPL